MMHFFYTLGTICCATTVAFSQYASAMVIDAPQRRPKAAITHSPSILPTPVITTAPTHDKKKQRFRIRRTHTSDLNAISTMLAMESVGMVQSSSSSQDISSMNWNYNMKYLRAKAQLEKQLTHRLAAVEEGRSTVQRMKEEQLRIHNGESHNDNDVDDNICHLWSTNNKLRTKIQTAVQNSNEDNPWTSHNFDTTPTIDMLNHIMISVIEVSSGNIVGFCEVACLLSPNNVNTMRQQMTDNENDNDDGIQRRILQVSDTSLDIPSSTCEETYDSYCDILLQEADDEDFSQSFTNHYSPAIVNLVTSSTHRRMGIASRIISFAKRYTSTQWKTSYRVNTDNNRDNNENIISLGLYVHPENESALRLYTKNGFEVVHPSLVISGIEDEEDVLLYLSHRGR